MVINIQPQFTTLRKYISNNLFLIHNTVKPFLIRGPQNQTAVVGSSVIFQCRVGGEPLPDVLWRRSASGGNMPLGKYTLHTMLLAFLYYGGWNSYNGRAIQYLID